VVEPRIPSTEAEQSNLVAFTVQTLVNSQWWAQGNRGVVQHMRRKKIGRSRCRYAFYNHILEWMDAQLDPGPNGVGHLHAYEMVEYWIADPKAFADRVAKDLVSYYINQDIPRGTPSISDMHPRSRVTKDRWKRMTPDERAAARAGIVWDNTNPLYDQTRYVQFLQALHDKHDATKPKPWTEGQCEYGQDLLDRMVEEVVNNHTFVTATEVILRELQAEYESTGRVRKYSSRICKHVLDYAGRTFRVVNDDGKYPVYAYNHGDKRYRLDNKGAWAYAVTRKVLEYYRQDITDGNFEAPTGKVKIEDMTGLGVTPHILGWDMADETTEMTAIKMYGLKSRHGGTSCISGSARVRDMFMTPKYDTNRVVYDVDLSAVDARMYAAAAVVIKPHESDLERKLKRKNTPMKMNREQVIVTGEKHLEEHKTKLAALQEAAKAKLAEYLPVLANKLATGRSPNMEAPSIESMPDRTDEYEYALNKIRHAAGAEIDSTELTELLITDPDKTAIVRERKLTFDLA
jgi:hypothetical protein